MIRLLVGLGNPGPEYALTRHNAGFWFIDAVAGAVHASLAPERSYYGLVARANRREGPVWLLEPMTFMNLSGDCVQPAQAFTKAQVGEIVVVHDELDVPFGEVRVKVGGGHAGHNGLRSIIERVGSPEFVRIRVGIGRPPPGFRGDVADYVLQNFDTAERA